MIGLAFSEAGKVYRSRQGFLQRTGEHGGGGRQSYRGLKQEQDARDATSKAIRSVTKNANDTEVFHVKEWGRPNESEKTVRRGITKNNGLRDTLDFDLGSFEQNKEWFARDTLSPSDWTEQISRRGSSRNIRRNSNSKNGNERCSKSERGLGTAGRSLRRTKAWNQNKQDLRCCSGVRDVVE